MNVTRIAIRRPTLAFVFVATMLLGGFVAMRQLIVQAQPSASLPTIDVRIQYAGSPASFIRDHIVRPLEDQIAGSPGLAHQNSTIELGAADILVQFRLDTNVDSDLAYIEQSLQAAQSQLPADLITPVTRVVNPAQGTVATIAVHSKKMPIAQLAQFANVQIMPNIEQLGGISDAHVVNLPQAAFEVTVDPTTLAASNLTLTDFVNTISQNNVRAPGGLVYGKYETQIDVRGDLPDVASIAGLPIKLTPPSFATTGGQRAAASSGVAFSGASAPAGGGSAASGPGAMGGGKGSSQGASSSTGANAASSVATTSTMSTSPGGSNASSSTTSNATTGSGTSSSQAGGAGAGTASAATGPASVGTGAGTQPANGASTGPSLGVPADGTTQQQPSAATNGGTNGGVSSGGITYGTAYGGASSGAPLTSTTAAPAPVSSPGAQVSTTIGPSGNSANASVPRAPMPQIPQPLGNGPSLTMSPGVGTLAPYSVVSANRKLGDFAHVELSSKPVRTYEVLDGKPGIVMQMLKFANASEITVAKTIEDHLAEIQQKFPGMTLHVDHVQATYSQAQVDGVIRTVLEAVVLVAIVMLLFLKSWRNAVVVLVAIPTSLGVTLLAMRVLNLTLDVVSLLAMSLVIGTLVDDSTVVLENIERHRHAGDEPADAALRGRSEIATAAVVITLVDVVVFLPIAFLGGVVGKQLSEFGIVVSVATLTSLMVSFVVTPTLAGRWSLYSTWKPWKPIEQFDRGFERVRGWYAERVLPSAVRAVRGPGSGLRRSSSSSRSRFSRPA